MVWPTLREGVECPALGGQPVWLDATAPANRRVNLRGGQRTWPCLKRRPASKRVLLEPGFPGRLIDRLDLRLEAKAAGERGIDVQEPGVLGRLG